jgi:hypothetical protein
VAALGNRYSVTTKDRGYAILLRAALRALALLAVPAVLCGGCSTSVCWVSRNSVPAKRLLPPPDSDEIGQQFHLKGVLMGGFEGAIVAPIEAFNFETGENLGILYCVRVADRCVRAFEKATRHRPRWSAVIEAVVTLQGEGDLSQCPFGTIRIDYMVTPSKEEKREAPL